MGKKASLSSKFISTDPINRDDLEGPLLFDDLSVQSLIRCPTFPHLKHLRISFPRVFKVGQLTALWPCMPHSRHFPLNFLHGLRGPDWLADFLALYSLLNTLGYYSFICTFVLFYCISYYSWFRFNFNWAFDDVSNNFGIVLSQF